MHSADSSPDSSILKINFNKNFTPVSVQPNLGDLVRSKVDNEEYFYGVEVSARSTHELNLEKFSVGPLFISIVWLSQAYSEVENVKDVDSLKLAQSLTPYTVVMPHFSCYRATPDRLASFLSLDFANVLTIRGDFFDDPQTYPHASDLVSAIRNLRGDTITVGVGGYPEGHPLASSLDEDMNNLVRKVNAGADFIITQVCFDAKKVIEFTRNCRSRGITVPIIAGVYAPESYNGMRRMLQITGVKVPDHLMNEFEKRRNDTTEFKQYSLEATSCFIREIFDSKSGIYGLQLFTLNQFDLPRNLVNGVIAEFVEK